MLVGQGPKRIIPGNKIDALVAPVIFQVIPVPTFVDFDEPFSVSTADLFIERVQQLLARRRGWALKTGSTALASPLRSVFRRAVNQ